MEGSVYGNIKYKMQYDFASSDPFKDAYIQVKKLPWSGTLRSATTRSRSRSKS